MAKPNALAMPSRLTAVGPEPMPPTTAAPQPKNTRAKVPTNSASCLFIASTLPDPPTAGWRLIQAGDAAEQGLFYGEGRAGDQRALPLRPRPERCFRRGRVIYASPFLATPR